MRMQRTADAQSYRRMTNAELRESFLIENLFCSGELSLTYTDVDRAVVGSAVPTDAPILLTADDALRADYFCQRRELGVMNIGGAGSVIVDGIRHDMANLDVLYVGRGSQEVVLESTSAGSPAKYILLSYPAHTEYATTHVTREQANRVDLGSDDAANKRTIFQYIHEDGIKSCQLVMGYTELATGSVWNTMPPHTHNRRSEVYLYFDITQDHRVLHLMGEPTETRGLWLSEAQAVLSPPWSIHCGCGTSNYRFLWGMGGENQRFADMDAVTIPELG